MMETSKTRSVFNTLAFSSIVLSIVCFMALVQVEVELHAHRKMLQVLTHHKEGIVSPSQTGNNELIAFRHKASRVKVSASLLTLVAE